MDLFQSEQNSGAEPLAARMRPRNLTEYVGQDHILGEGRLLRRAIQADQLSSLIFYGPPGTGKTTLARVIANSTKSYFISLNAVLSGVKELRAAIDDAREKRDLYDRRTILFVDEVHRWNKSQQDALLPWVENGTIILIGATTENPYFEVNSALVSRSRVFQLKELTDRDLRAIVRQALEDKSRGYGRWQVSLAQEGLDHLVSVASGDARSLLNALQLAVETTPEQFPPPEGTEIHIDLGTCEESIQKKVVLYDKEGDYHFDTISAFIKSIRGSDPDAALYWMARMIRAGEDPRFIIRRMLISASEDIGMADPQALGVVTAAAAAIDRVGLPEGQFHLTQAALYLATAPKSNSSLAYFDAVRAVDKEQAEVPNHLKDPSRDKHAFGHGEGYNYPHAYRDHWVAQQYLPGTLKGRLFYQPSAQGYEGKIQEDVLRRREAQLAVMLDEAPEVLTYSPGGKERDRWLKRTMGAGSALPPPLFETLFKDLKFTRHDRLLVAPVVTGQLFWEAFRKVPEGGVWGLADSLRVRELIGFSLESLPASERPLLIERETVDTLPDLEGIFLSEPLRRDMGEVLLSVMISRLVPGGFLRYSEIDRSRTTRLSSFLEETGSGGNLSEELIGRIRNREESLYGPLVSEARLGTLFSRELKEESVLTVETGERRHISASLLDTWINPEKSAKNWGAVVKKDLSEEEWEEVKRRLENRLLEKDVDWKRFWTVGTYRR
ncbi:MAG: AAA family ATPase [Spirochaetales bacterium]|nr:AAA family ATPase [Spirochaetales bacterium]